MWYTYLFSPPHTLHLGDYYRIDTCTSHHHKRPEKEEKWFTLCMASRREPQAGGDEVRQAKCTDHSELSFQHIPLGCGLAKDSFAFWELLLFKLFSECVESARNTHLYLCTHPLAGAEQELSWGRSNALLSAQAFYKRGSHKEVNLPQSFKKQTTYHSHWCSKHWAGKINFFIFYRVKSC